MVEKQHPPQVDFPRDGQGSSGQATPTQAPPPLRPSVPDNVAAVTCSVSSGVSDAEQPPSYQAAMSYPTLPPPHTAYGQPPANPHFAKPPVAGFVVPPGYTPYPPPPGVGCGFPPPQHVEVPVGRAVVVTVHEARAGALPVPGERAGLHCAHCAVGRVMKETDMCCLLCLVLLAIFTFPFGLVFLCCVPCTVHRRCDHCHRIG